MLLTLITNQTALAQYAEAAGIDRVMIDLERKGKAQRQIGRQLFLSDHTWGDVDLMRRALHRSAIHVRINPWHEDSGREIHAAITRGASIVMLPMIRDIDDVRRFVDEVHGRARTSLLMETSAALEQAADLTRIPGVDEIHVGLNDLSIDMGRAVIFEVLCDRQLDELAAASHGAGIAFGFGGVASSSAKPLPVDPELILAEQARLKSDVGILGRSFRRLCDGTTPERLAEEVRWIRETFGRWTNASPEDYQKNLVSLGAEVASWKKQLSKAPPG
jgi:citrate lyase beta subunit